jgi:predicted permease
MKSLRRFLARIQNTTLRRQQTGRMREEMETHLSLLTEEMVRAGHSPEEARRRARLKFGGAEGVRENYEAERRWLPLEWLAQDVRFGLRMLRKSPGFTAVAVLTLALGIGANTAIFSLVDAVMLRSLPVKDPAHLMALEWHARSGINVNQYSGFGDCARAKEDFSGCSFPLPILKQLRKQKDVWSSLTASAGTADLDLSGQGPAKIAGAEFAAGNYFSTLGVGAALGRLLGPEDDTPSSDPAAVLSYAYWQQEFGGKRSVIGKTILLNNVPFTVVGVAAKSFTHLTPGKTQDLWITIAMMPRMSIDWGEGSNTMQNWWLLLLGRLQPGVAPAHAQSESSAIFRNEVLYGGKPMWSAADNPRLTVLPASTALNFKKNRVATLLTILMCAVGIVLLIACANVAGLLLARASGRQREMAVRLALGARRARLVRQLLTESVMLSTAGGVLGAGVAYWGIHAITSVISFPFAIAMDGRVLLFTAGACLLTGVAFGLAPALRSTKVDLTPALKKNAGASHPHGGKRRMLSLGNALVMAQVALSVVVLMAAGLLVHTLTNLREINPGFNMRNLLVFEVNPSLLGYSAKKTAHLYEDLQQRFAALPGVKAASYSSNALLSDGSWTESVNVEGHPHQNLDIDVLAAGPDFFRTMQIPLVAGRTFRSMDYSRALQEKKPGLPQPKDAVHAPMYVIVNQAFAHAYFPAGQVLGKRIYQGSHDHAHDSFTGKTSSRYWQIVGVVANTKYDTLRHGVQPIVFLPLSSRGAYFELRTGVDPHALIGAVRHAAHQVDSNLPLTEMQTQTEVVDGLLAQERLMARLSSFFAVLALALACMGLYGLLSYEVARRTREIGIRMALGSPRGEVLRLVMREGILLAVLGAATGTAVSLGVMQSLKSVLYEVHAGDPATMAAVVGLLTVVSAAACYLPARRAMKVEPVVALRCE